MSNKGLWIVYENINTEVEVFNIYEKAIKYYEERKDDARLEGVDGIDPDEKIYLAKVERQAFWKEDKDQPIYKTDEYGDETEEESGDYYWILTEGREK